MSKPISQDGARLVERLKREFDLVLPDDVVIKTNHSYQAYRDNGAWRWHFFSQTAVCHNIGSCSRLRECVKAETLELYRENGDIEIIVLKYG